MEDMIIAAIHRRYILSFTYDGQPRTANPHALYSEDRLRKVVLHAWQTDGGSNSGVMPGWKNFHLDEISGLNVLHETPFEARADFNPSRFRNSIHSL